MNSNTNGGNYQPGSSSVSKNAAVNRTVPNTVPSNTEEKNTSAVFKSVSTENKEKATKEITVDKKDKIITELQDKGVEWIDVSQAGDIGAEMVALGLSKKEKVYAPEGISEKEAESQGFRNQIFEGGSMKYWKRITLVPSIRREELDEIKKEIQMK